jgi:transcriptional regulator with PAS, ATPase and Fis domain
LFGHAKGAFTGALRDHWGKVNAAAGGTLFLDEIGDLPLPLQGKLLRVLQEREVRRVGETKVRRVDLRVVAATHRDLAAMAEAGTFRPDLLYRLRGVELVLEPLRNRPRDLAALVDAALAGAALSPAASDLVRRYRWPGNVRELAAALESARALAAPGRVVGPEHLPAAVRGARGAAPRTASYRDAVADAKRGTIQRALDESGGNRTQAAKRLGLSRQSLLYEMKVLGLAAPRNLRPP